MRALFLSALSLLAACQCGTDVKPIGAGFTISPDTQHIDFGRALEGTTVRAKVTLVAETRASLTVTGRTQVPFGVPATVEVVGGTSTDVPVTFVAGNGRVDGEATFTSNGKQRTVTLTGFGVRPPQCLPSSPCVTSVYSLELDRCVETALPDDSNCDPGSECLEQGRCQRGACLGVPRKCDDNNVCTNDACAMGQGCVHTPVTCPSGDTCQTPTCNPISGCGLMPAPDFTVCGAADCVTANLCVGGQCKPIPTPDGVVCATPVACLPQATCQQHLCVRPDAGAWLPTWSALLAGEPRPPLRSFQGAVYFTGCGVSVMQADGGTIVDAGCGLVSYTGSGFERFTNVTVGDARLSSVSSRGVVVFADGGLRLRARAGGVPAGEFFLDDATAQASAVTSDGALVGLFRGNDGGAVLAHWLDGGVTLDAVLDGGDAVAIDEAGRITVAGPDGLEFFDVDGGRALLSLDGGARFVTTSSGLFVVDGRVLLRPLRDGGVVRFDVPDFDDAGVAIRAEALAALQSPSAVVVRYRRCRSMLMSCLPSAEEVWTRVMDPQSGQTLWEVPLLPGVDDGRVVEQVLFNTPSEPGTFLTVLRNDLDGGAELEATLQAFSRGTRVLLCDLPRASRAVEFAHFSGDQLFVVVRTSAGYRLEAFPLHSLNVDNAPGWPQVGGARGEARALP